MRIAFLSLVLLGFIDDLTTASPTPATNTLAKRAINVLTPRWGYTVQFPGNHTEISWTEPTTRDLRITLVRGAPGQLVEVGPYESCMLC
jgi:hypothetical protein